MVQRDIEQFASFADIGKDSFYPLVTEDPSKRKEFTLKITDNHLNKVFGNGAVHQSQFNLQSIYIEENYIGGEHKQK